MAPKPRIFLIPVPKELQKAEVAWLETEGPVAAEELVKSVDPGLGTHIDSNAARPPDPKQRAAPGTGRESLPVLRDGR